MTTVLVSRKFIVPRLAPLLFGLLAVHSTPTFGQREPERFWLAGRYDGNRVVVYFDAVIPCPKVFIGDHAIQAAQSAFL